VLEVAKQRVEPSQKNEYQDILEMSAHSKTKEVTAHRVRAGDIRALATLGSLPVPTERRIFTVCILFFVS
jgi:hypothetical protein